MLNQNVIPIEYTKQEDYIQLTASNFVDLTKNIHRNI